MIPEDVVTRINKLLDGLILRTKADAVQWEKSSVLEGSVQLSTESTSFLLVSIDPGITPGFIFRVYDSDGATAIEIRTNDSKYPVTTRHRLYELDAAVIESQDRKLTHVLDKAIDDIDSIPPF